MTLPNIRLLFCLLVCLAAVPFLRAQSAGLDPHRAIEEDGSITLCDGSSYYTFSRGGGFLSGPIGKSGRRLEGSWKADAVLEPGIFSVVARYEWMEGDEWKKEGYRKIRFRIGPGEKRPFREQMVPAISEFHAYLVIEELITIPAPEGV
ncbi:MAG TPA: hypothetical protein VNQ90_09610 [Chthoniobacteraceae bacterium]|nr:hypothetical protein [Chthoniobacteraceae bacterium]